MTEKELKESVFKSLSEYESLFTSDKQKCHDTIAYLNTILRGCKTEKARSIIQDTIIELVNIKHNMKPARQQRGCSFNGVVAE